MENLLIASQRQVEAWQGGYYTAHYAADFNITPAVRIKWGNLIYQAIGGGCYTDVFHEGHKRALAEVDAMSEGALHIESHARGWQVSMWQVYDMLTYALAFPQKVQVFAYATNACARQAIVDKIKLTVEKMQNSPELLKQFPLLDKWEVDDYGLERYESWGRMIHWGPWQDLDPELKVDRAWLTGFGSARHSDLAKVLQKLDHRARVIVTVPSSAPDTEGRE